MASVPVTTLGLSLVVAGGGRAAGRWERKAARVVMVRVRAIKYKGTQQREQRLAELIEEKVVEAKQVCEGDEVSDECRVAWDEVEEVSQAKAHLRHKLLLEKRDPLHHFCQDHPETDECRIYDP